MNLVPFIMKAHFSGDDREVLKKKTSKYKYPLRLLRDGQGFLVENGRVELVGDGKEEKL